MTDLRGVYGTRTSGHMVQIADQEIVFRERSESREGNMGAFTQFSSIRGPSSPYRAVLAWALWGSDATCDVKIAGVPVDVHVDGAATYVPPTSFHHGLYYVEGSLSLLAGRSYETSALGGPLFAAMRSGDEYFGTFASRAGAESVVDACSNRYIQCTHFGARRATSLVATFTAADFGGWDPGELWMISLPPGVFD